MRRPLLLLRSPICCFILPTYRKERMGGAVEKGKLMETEKEGTKEEGISDGPPVVPS